MRKRGGYSDGVMKFLLRGYERPGLDREAMDGLVRALEERTAGRGLSIDTRPARPGITRLRLAAARIAAAAAAIVVFVALGLYALSSSTAGTPWKLDDAIASPVRPMTGKAVVRADAGGRRILSSANETVILEAGAVLEVSGSFMHVFTRDASNVYTLKTGTVAIDHTGGGFRLVTPWAAVVPTGTLVRASVSEDTVFVACDGGAIDVRPLDGSRAYALRSGESLTATRSGDMWTVSVGPGPAVDVPAAVALDDAVEAPATMSLQETPDAAGPTGASEPASASEPSSSPVPGAKATAGRFVVLWSADTGTRAADVSGLALGPGAAYLYRSASGGDSILRFSMEDGRPLGTTSLGATYEKYAFHGDRVYLVSGATLSALDAGSGAALWRAEAGPMGFAELTVERGRVYLPSADGALYVFEAATGSTVDKLAAGSGLYGKPLVANGRIVFSSISKELRSVDETSLAEVWKASVPGGLLGDAPIAAGALVVTGDAAGNLLAFGRDDGRLAWSVRTGQAGTAAAFGLDGGALFMLDGKPAVAYADGSAAALAGMDGDILAADRSGTVVTGAGLYRLSRPGAADGYGLVPGSASGPEGTTLRGAIDGRRILILTADGRLESWRWVE